MRRRKNDSNEKEYENKLDRTLSKKELFGDKELNRKYE